MCLAISTPAVLPSVGRKAGFDAFVEGVCKPYYAPRMGAPSLPPGRYFRMHTIGYFEGIDSERGIAWPGRERQGLSASQGWPRPAPVNNRRHLHPPGGGASPALPSGVPPSTQAATYRARTMVRKNTRNPKRFFTFTLPQYVALS